MPILPEVFNPQGQDGLDDFSAIPPGEYYAMIIKSDIKPTKNGNGFYAQYTWKVLAGDFAGRQLWDRLNIVNPTQATVEIAKKTQKSMCDAMGIVGPVTTTEEFHAHPCLIRVVKVPADSQYGESNDIKGFDVIPAEHMSAIIAAAGNPVAASVGSASNVAAVQTAAAPVPVPATPTIVGQPEPIAAKPTPNNDETNETVAAPIPVPTPAPVTAAPITTNKPPWVK